MIDGDWTQITNQLDWERLCSQAAGFHDGFIKEFTWENPDFVDEKTFNLHFEGPVRGRILIQMQNHEMPIVEVLVSVVQKCVITARADEPAECRFERGKIILKLLQIQELQAHSIAYRVPSRT